MEITTGRSADECARIFENAVSKRPLKLKIFPFQCSRTSSGVQASFQRGEPYGVVAMQCRAEGNKTRVTFSVDGNIRGRITANSLAKHIAAQLQGG
jgi:hypothetical protein